MKPEDIPTSTESTPSGTESTREKTNAQPPAKLTGLKLSDPPMTAGGLKAVRESLKHLRKETGVVSGMLTLSRMNQKGGFDCPGCAWPDPDDKRSLGAEYCENGAKAVAEEATRKRADVDFFKKHSVAEMGGWSDYEIGKSGRLTEPMVLREGATHYEPISWEAAFEMIAEELNGLASPDEAVFYTSGRTSNEAAFLYQLFVRAYGTNNLPDCSNMCHESSGVALSQTVGIGKGSVTLEDLHEADVIMVVGQNPGTNHPRMMSALQACRQNDGKIIAVNPLPEPGLMNFRHPQHPRDLVGKPTRLANLFLQVRVNGDVALAKGLMHLMWRAEQERPGEVFDWDFIKEKTNGSEALLADIADQDIVALSEACGIPVEQMESAAELLIEKQKIIICWAMGLTQHRNGVQNIREFVNLLLLKGSIGKPGAGTCPVRGHSNVQGDRTMGIWEAPKSAFLDALDAATGITSPREHGLDVVHSIEAMHAGKARVFFAMGGNFISATPDTEFTAKALRRCSLTVQVSTKLNRSHLIHGRQALILPCLGRTERDVQGGVEQFVSVENSMGVVHSSRGTRKPASEALLSEPVIVARLAKAVVGDLPKVDWEAVVEMYDRTRELIEAVIPGFENFNERVREQGGFYLPNGAREGRFHTTSGKAEFTVNTVPEHKLAKGEYVMFTVRTHDQYNTTIYGLNDRYRGIHHERRVVMMHAKDMEAEGIAAEAEVDLVGEYDGETRVAERFIAVPFDVPRGCVATYFPEANVLVPIGSRAVGSHTPTSKFVVVRVRSRG